MVLGTMSCHYSCHCQPSGAILRARQAVCDIRRPSENIQKLSEGLETLLLVFL